MGMFSWWPVLKHMQIRANAESQITLCTNIVLSGQVSSFDVSNSTNWFSKPEGMPVTDNASVNTNLGLRCLTYIGSLLDINP